jgi:hypothetical protein
VLESSVPGASNGIRSALKSTDPGAFNGRSNFEIRPLEADLVSFEVARMPEKRVRFWQNSKMSQNAYETSKLSETTGESSGQVHNVSTGFLMGLRANCDHKVPKRGLSTDRTAGVNFGKNPVILSILL